MPVTVNVNKMSLCHKGSNGIVMATIPDVCKTPAPPAGPIPLPYPNIAMSSNLAKGTKKVKADGQSCAISPSEFSTSVGDEPGTVGGIVSNVNKNKATWIMFSFNVFMEGKPTCRLMDKMLMNKGNTVSLSGLLQKPLTPGQINVKLCELACECADPPGGKYQVCMAKKLQADPSQYDADGYPSDQSQIWKEVHMTKNKSTGEFEVLKNKSARVRPAGTAPSRRQRTPRGGIRPDICVHTKSGKVQRIIEVKFPGDSPNKNQKPGGKYYDAADDLGAKFQFLDVEKCPCWAAAKAEADATTPQEVAAAQAQAAKVKMTARGANKAISAAP